MKRTPLKPSTKPLKRTALVRGTSKLRTRKRLNPVSQKKRAGAPEREAVRQAVFARDGHCVALDLWPGHRCWGDQRKTFHHVKKASAGGAYSVANGRTLCSGFNDWIETAVGDDRVLLKRVGLIR